MANTLKIKRGAAATIPQGELAEPLFTTDTYDLYIGKGGALGNQRFQKYIASGTSSQFLKGDGSLDSTTYQATSEKGQNNGYASLDAGGKIPAAQLPSSVIEYKGTWNASTNTPTLADGTGDAGDVYIVSVGGTQNLGSGNISFDAGDWVMYNGSVWQKSTGSNAVASVNGQTGIVVLDTDDISEPVSPTNLWFTNARARTAISLTTSGSSGAATYDNSTGVLNVPNYGSSLTSYVPYTGATTNVDLGANNLTSKYLLADGTTGLGGVMSIKQSATYLAQGNGYSSIASSNIDFDFFGYTGASTYKNFAFRFNGLTDNTRRTYTLPDASGTLALGTGTINTIAYWDSATSIASLSTTSYPSLTELSYVKGVTSAIQTQLNAKEPTVTKGNLTETTSSVLTITGGTGAVIGSGTTIAVASAGASQAGVVTTGTQTFAGNKTFLGTLNGTSAAFTSTEQNSFTVISGTNDTLRLINGGTGYALYVQDNSYFQGDVYVQSISPSPSILKTNSSKKLIAAVAGTDYVAPSALSSYLPLSGGTLTGALSGTSASMSSTSTATAFIPTGSSVPTNGMYLSGANTLSFSTLSTRAITISDGQNVGIGADPIPAYRLYVNGDIYASATVYGTAASFISTGTFSSTVTATAFIPSGSSVPTNGMYLSAANTLNFATNSGSRLSIASTGAATFSSSVTANGISSIGQEQAFTFQRTTGTASDVYSFNADSGSAYLYNNTTAKPLMVWAEGGNVGIGTTSATQKITTVGSYVRYHALSEDNTNAGAYFQVKSGSTTVGQSSQFVDNAGNWIIYTGTSSEAERMRITSGGNVTIGYETGYTNVRLNTRGANTSSSDWAFFAENSSGGTIIGARNDSQVYAGGIGSTTGTTLVLDSSGYIKQSSSSIRYKKDIKPIDIGLNFILKLNPVSYLLKEGDIPQVGFIAEDFPDERLVSMSMVKPMDESAGYQKEGVNYAQIVAPLVKAIQEQQAQIEELKAKLN